MVHVSVYIIMLGLQYHVFYIMDKKYKKQEGNSNPWFQLCPPDVPPGGILSSNIVHQMCHQRGWPLVPTLSTRCATRGWTMLELSIPPGGTSGGGYGDMAIPFLMHFWASHDILISFSIF